MKSSGATSASSSQVTGAETGAPGLRPDAVGRGDRAIARVLVVVDEDPLAALLLPPLGRHLVGEAPLELTPERDRRVADVGERPARLDPDVDVDASAARGLREAGVAELVQQRARLGGDAHGVGEVRARLRVEVDAQLVRMVDVVAANRPRVKRDRAHLRRPADDGHLGGADLVRVAARRELDPRRLHVVRSSAWDALLEEGVAAALLARREDDAGVHALGPALERRRPPRERAHDAVPDGEVVPDDVELGDRAERSVGGKITRSGLDTRRSRPPASTIVASDAAMPRSSTACRAARSWPRPLPHGEAVPAGTPDERGDPPGQVIRQAARAGGDGAEGLRAGRAPARPRAGPSRPGPPPDGARAAVRGSAGRSARSRARSAGRRRRRSRPPARTRSGCRDASPCRWPPSSRRSRARRAGSAAR